MIRLAFTGDIMLSRGVEDAISNSPKSWEILSPDVKDKLKSYDFVIGNLECPLTTDAKKLSENSFKANPKNLEQVLDFDLLTLANNHIFDCGKYGAQETLKYLKNNDYNFCGLSSDKNNGAGFITSINGKKIGFIAAAVDNCIKNESDQFPYIVKAETSGFLEYLREFREKVDFMFLLIHGGNEMISYPEPSFQKLCKSFIDVGADCVITHHPHVLGGYEIFKGKPIIYSLGDFIFDGQSYKRRRGAILDVCIINNEIKFTLIPTQITDDLQVQLAKRKISDKIITKWNRVSEKIVLNNYTKKYRNLYLLEMIGFQIDRLGFLLKNEGVIATFKFMFNKVNLLRFYTIQVLKGNIK